ncbi:MAG: FHA domain-containing protein [Chloroflexi bacterium]|nr:FHA domain-containing protein [Chloroflexota bacterium]
MRRLTRITTWLCAVTAALLVLATPGAAQRGDPVAINVSFAEVTDGPNETTALGLYFTVNDANGDAIDPGSARQAVIQLEDGTRTEARVEEANSPLFVVIVLDASGSMGAAADTMRQAAITAVQNLPDGTRFSVMTFNRQISTATEFSQDKNGVINTIAQYAPARPSDPNAGTCLFDATFAAMQKATEVPLPNRRSVMLFTDGRDELIAGGALDPCSSRTLDEVVARASDIANPVNVYAIGLTGSAPIAQGELQRITDSSNGIAVFGDLNALPALFERIVASLRNQRVARADVCITRGQHTATLLIQAGGGAGGASLADSINFVTNFECIPATPTPEIDPEVNIDSATFDPATDTITFVLSAAGEDQIEEYRVEAVDRDGNTVASFVQNSPISGPISFSAAGAPDGNVEITVRAIRRDGTTAADDERTVRVPRPTATFTRTATFTPSPTITPTPRPRSANIDGIQYDRDTDEVIVNLLYREIAEISRIRVSIFDENNTLVRVIEPPSLSDQVFFVGRANGLEPGARYSIRVQALDGGGAILNESTQEFTYVPILSPTPTFTETPSITPTPTEVIVRAAIDAVTFDANAQQFVLRIAYENAELIDTVEIDILDSNNLLVDTISVPVAETVTYTPGSKLIGQQQYSFSIKAINLEGRVIDRQVRQFTDPRTSTPTPTQTPTHTLTPTITPTPTVTPVVVDLTLNPPVEDIETQTLRVEYVGSNPDAVDRYTLVLVQRSGSNIITEQSFIPSEETFRTINMSEVPSGEYTLTLAAFDDDDNELAETSISFRWTKPDPTATPTPPGIVDRIRENPVLGVVVGLIVLILVGVLVWLLLSGRRERTKRQNTAASLPSQTGAFIIPQMPQAPKPSGDQPKTTPPAGPSKQIGSDTKPNFLDEPTIRPGADSFSTNAAIDVGEATGAAPVVNGYIIVRESRDESLVGKTFPLSKSPYYIGRSGPRQNDLNIDGDKNLSRAHCELIFDRNAWYVVDSGSQLGTTVNDGARITGRVPLSEGDVIKLGGTTVIAFTRRG